MTTKDDIMDAERKCHSSQDFTEYQSCLKELNDIVGEYLTERFGEKGLGCNTYEYHERNIGTFIQNVMNSIGLSVDDISDVHLDCEMHTRNVFALETKDNNRIWIKASGTNGPISLTEMIVTREVSDIADIIGEDTPHIIHQDVPNRLMAISNIEGRTLRGDLSVYNQLSPTEIATNTLFEIILMDGDRVRDNVRKSDGIISEIDFAVIQPVDSLHQWRNTKTSNHILKRLFNDLDRIQAGHAPHDREWTQKYITSMRQKINEFEQKKHDIKHIAPNMSKWNLTSAEKILSELETFLSKTEDAMSENIK
jgi:hypothetical protein